MASAAPEDARLSRVSLLSDDVRSNPQPFFAELVSKAPVLWSEAHRAWLVARYEHVMTALRHEAVTSDRVAPYVASRIRQEDRSRFERMFDILARWMVFLSPPDHTRLRGLVHRSFTPRRVQTLQGQAETVARDLAQGLRRQLESGTAEVDLIEAFCEPLPGTVIAGLFGVPVDDGPRLKRWAEELGLFINGALGESGRDERVAAAMVEFEAYLAQLIEGYRRAPADNVLSGLVAANESGGQLDHDELIATCMLILDAGYKTIQHALANALLTFLEHPTLWQELGAHPELGRSVVEECLRHSPPGHVIVRRAANDLELGGQRIKAGARLYLLIGAANRDPARFEDPHAFRTDRTSNLHLTFGHGIHFCLGAALARMEMNVALTTLVREVPRLALACHQSELRWRPVLILQGLERLPVRLLAQSAATQ